MTSHRLKSGVLSVLLALGVFVLVAGGESAMALPGEAAYDLVIKNGRVIDPETGRDEIAAVAVKGGTIVRIAAGPELEGARAGRTIDATGMVVSPGFINTHTHEATKTANRDNISPLSMIVAYDGVTFWLGGNCGMSPTGVALDLGDGNVMRYGDPEQPLGEFLDQIAQVPLYTNYATLSGNITLRSMMGLKHMEKEKDEQIEKMKAILARDLAAGSFGVSFGVMYDMGATTKAMIELARVSQSAGGMAASHTRYPTFNLQHLSGGIDNVVLKRSISEAIETCRASRVPFIVSHITDMSQADSLPWVMETLDNAIRKEGLPLAGDIIGHDFLGNDFYILTFKGKIPVGFMLKLGNFKMDQFYVAQDVKIDGKLYVEKYGQLTLDQAEYLRKNIKRIDGFGTSQGLGLICEIIPPKDTKLALQYPWVFIGNDYGGGSFNAPGEYVAGSPRALGTFSRLLGHWSRQEKAISLQQALFKATIAPALWLGLSKKGRIQEGCDADIVIFDPETIIDRAGWLHDAENLKPDGIGYVIVNGEVVVENNRLTGKTPGHLIRRTWKIPGDTAAVLSLYQRRFGSK
jgi:N-acyl-D-aspartate/D-glutamate deacylase